MDNKKQTAFLPKYSVSVPYEGETATQLEYKADMFIGKEDPKKYMGMMPYNEPSLDDVKSVVFATEPTKTINNVEQEKEKSAWDEEIENRRIGYNIEPEKRGVVTSALRGIGSVASNIPSSLGGIARMGGDAGVKIAELVEGKDLPEQAKQQINEEMSAAINNVTDAIGIGKLQKYLAKDERDKSLAYDLGSLLGSLGLVWGVSAATKSVNAASAVFGVFEGTDIYTLARDKGVSPGRALALSLSGGVGTAMLEKWGLQNFLETYTFKSLKGVPLKIIAKQMGVEGTQEFSQSMLSSIVRADLENGWQWIDWLKQASYEGLLGATVSPVVGGIKLATTKETRNKWSKVFQEKGGMNKDDADYLAQAVVLNPEDATKHATEILNNEAITQAMMSPEEKSVVLKEGEDLLAKLLDQKAFDLSDNSQSIVDQEEQKLLDMAISQGIDEKEAESVAKLGSQITRTILADAKEAGLTEEQIAEEINFDITNAEDTIEKVAYVDEDGRYVGEEEISIEDERKAIQEAYREEEVASLMASGMSEDEARFRVETGREPTDFDRAIGFNYIPYQIGGETKYLYKGREFYPNDEKYNPYVTPQSIVLAGMRDGKSKEEIIARINELETSRHEEIIAEEEKHLASYEEMWGKNKDDWDKASLFHYDLSEKRIKSAKSSIDRINEIINKVQNDFEDFKIETVKPKAKRKKKQLKTVELKISDKIKADILSLKNEQESSNVGQNMQEEAFDKWLDDKLIAERKKEFEDMETISEVTFDEFSTLEELNEEISDSGNYLGAKTPFTSEEEAVEYLQNYWLENYDFEDAVYQDRGNFNSADFEKYREEFVGGWSDRSSFFEYYQDLVADIMQDNGFYVDTDASRVSDSKYLDVYQSEEDSYEGEPFAKIRISDHDTKRFYGHHINLYTDRPIEEEIAKLVRAFKDGDFGIEDTVYYQTGGEVRYQTEEVEDQVRFIDRVKNLFKPLAKDVRTFISDLNKVLKGEDTRIRVGNLPFVYKKLGFKDGIVRTNKDIIVKDTIEKHNVPLDVVDILPELYSDPLVVMESRTEKGRLVAVVDAKDEDGNQIIVVISPNEKAIGGYHFIPSFYGKDEFEEFMEINAKENRIKYVKDNSVSDTLQLRSQAFSDVVLNNNILHKSDIVNRTFYQTVYAGSRVDYDKPSLEAIGTGEGQQAHGWGLYYALSRDTAERYREYFDLDNYFFDEEALENERAKAEKEAGKTKDYSKVELLEDLLVQHNESNLSNYPEDLVDWYNKNIRNKVLNKDYKKSQVHEVELPENPYLLDEQKTFEEQSDFVKQKLEEIFSNLPEEYLKEYPKMGIERVKEIQFSGSEIYGALSEAYGSDKEASLLLNKYGIKGITYDGKQDGRCFVIFNPKDVKVIQKFYQTGVEEIDNSNRYKYLPQNLKDAVDFVYNNEPVVEITGNEFQKDGIPLTEKVTDFYKENYNEEVTREDIGVVKLDKEGVKDSLGHGIGSKKAAAYAAVPEVIKNGFIFDRQSNWKGRGYDTVVLVAPIKIGGKNHICEVVIKQGTDRQGFYLHEVEVQENFGEVFKTANGSTPPTKLIIAQNIASVNTALYNISDSGGGINLEVGGGRKPIKPYKRHPLKVMGQYEPTKKMITLFKGRNPTTLVHEMGHHYLPIHLRLLEKAGKWDKLKPLYQELGISSVEQMGRDAEEKLIDMFTSYIYYNEAPNVETQSIFERAKQWMISAYNTVKNFVKPSEEVTKFFDELIAGEENAPDVSHLVGKEAELSKILQGARHGQELTINGLSMKDIAILRQALHARVPRRGRSLADVIRQAGGIDSRSEIAKALGYDSRKGGEMGFWNYRGTIDNEQALIELLVAEGFLFDVEQDSAEGVQAVWNKVEQLINNRDTTFSEAEQMQNEKREQAYKVQELVNNILVKHYNKDIKTLEEDMKAVTKKLADIGAVAVDKATLEYLQNSLEKMSKDYRKLLSEKKEKQYKYQEELTKFIKSSPLNNKDKLKLIDKIRMVKDERTFEKYLGEAKSQIEKYVEAESKRVLDDLIQKEIKSSRPRKAMAQLYNYENNKLFADLREWNKLNQDNAEAMAIKLDEVIAQGGGELSRSDKLRRMFLEYKTFGKDCSVEFMQALHDEIKAAKQAGIDAKDDADFMRAFEREQERQDVLNKLKESTADKNKFSTKVANAYRRGISNLYSMLNSIAGKGIAEKYEFETLLEHKETKEWNHLKGTSLSAQSIYKSESYGDLLNVMADKGKPMFTLYKKAETGDPFAEVLDENFKYELSVLDLIDIYNSMKNKKTAEDYAEAYGAGQIKALLSNLTAEDKALGDMLMEDVNNRYKDINRVYINLYGMDLKKVDNYWMSSTEHSQPVDIYNDFKMQSTTPGFFKERTAGRVIPVPKNAWLKYQNHISQGYYMTEIAEKFKEMSEVFKSKRIENMIKNKFGDGVYNTLREQIESIGLNAQNSRLDDVSAVFQSNVNNWIGAKIAVNPLVLVGQLTSFTNYAVDVNAKAYLKNFAYALRHPKEVLDFMMKYHKDFLMHRYESGFNEAMNRFIKDATNANGMKFGFSAKAKYKWSNALSSLVRLGDMGAIVFGGYGQFKTMLDSGMSVEEAKQKFEFATLRSQQSGNAASISGWQKAKGVSRMFLGFKNTPMQYTRKIVDAIISLENGDISKVQASKILANYLLVQPALWVFVKNVAKDLLGLDDEDDEYSDGILEQILVNPIEAIPFASDLVKAGYKAATGERVYSVISMPMLDDVEKAFRKTVKEEKDVYDYADIIIPFIEMTTSAPVATTKRYAQKWFGEEE